MGSASYAPEGWVAVGFLVAPIVLGIAALFVPPRAAWTARLLAAPALLMGIAFTWAVIRAGPGYGGVVGLLYGPVLLGLGLLAALRPYARRGDA
jgi:hypothetical protein